MSLRTTRMVLLSASTVGLVLAGCGTAPVGGPAAPPGTATSINTPTSSVKASTPPRPTSATLPPGSATPQGAIRVWMAKQGYTYAGDCSTTRLETDAGKYCSSLHTRQDGRRIYGVGPTFSEYTTWLLVKQSSGGWRVTATAKDNGTSPPPW